MPSLYQENVSAISEQRQRLIRKALPRIEENLHVHRDAHLAKISKGKIALDTPGWVRVNPAPPVSDHDRSFRLCVGFRNSGCEYRESDPKKLGCLNCGYYAGTAFENVDGEILLTQLQSAIRTAAKECTPYNAIEFLNDGSFLNPREFDRETQKALFSLVAQMPHIKRVLIESRANYIKSDSITFLLSCLRPDQRLEVGIGFESADDFVREVCINKGSSRKAFERAIQVLQTIQADEGKERVAILAYLLIKPAFLTPKESVEDIILTLKYFAGLQDRSGIEIIPKLEPAAIVDGTILSLLYAEKSSPFYYEPLNYWATLEILARTYSIPEIRRYCGTIRIGAREDMDDIVVVPAVYDEHGKFDPFDYVLYDAIQKYNQHHDVHKLFAVITGVFNSRIKGSMANYCSLLGWYNNAEIEQRGIVYFLDVESDKISAAAKSLFTQMETRFLIVAWDAMNGIEGLDEDHLDYYQAIKAAFDSEEPEDIKKHQIGEAVKKIFHRVDPRMVVQPKINVLSQADAGQKEIFLDVKDLLRNTKYSLWCRLS
uniref:Radical SAM enzyme, TIGR01210 family n=1 Tax=Candidatus Kentrum sp. DK TaxID=2126562 RepID=A0A450T2X0_9GAMM|nr:MAG: radical SAM enzyme, TIGR01210 family [Candidatus Kentron sp. DK]